MAADPGTGLHDIPEAVYHASPRVSRSNLWYMRQSPMHCRHNRLNPPEKAVFDMGAAVHCAALEPDRLDDNYACRPEGINARKKAGQAELAEWREANADKTLLESADAMQTLRGVSAAVLAHPKLSRLVSGEGMTEKSVYWTDEHTGLDCRARFDRIVPYKKGVAGFDLKTIGRDANFRRLEQSIRDYGYHFQAGMYLSGLDAAVGEMPRAFVLGFVETKPPHGIRIVELDTAYIDAGRRIYRELLDQYAACKASNNWPGYPSDITILEAPEWM